MVDTAPNKTLCYFRAGTSTVKPSSHIDDMAPYWWRKKISGLRIGSRIRVRVRIRKAEKASYVGIYKPSVSIANCFNLAHLLFGRWKNSNILADVPSAFASSGDSIFLKRGTSKYAGSQVGDAVLGSLVCKAIPAHGVVFMVMMMHVED